VATQGLRGCAHVQIYGADARLWPGSRVSYAGDVDQVFPGAHFHPRRVQMSYTNPSNQCPFVTDDRSAAERDARRRSSEQQIEYVLASREYFEGEVEYIVAPMDDFRELHGSGGWLIDDLYGRLITPDELVAESVCCDIDEALLEATMRISHGAPSLFIGIRDGDYLVAPLSAWRRFSAVGWVKLDDFKAKRS
jgi:hypothetical protein